MIRHFENVSYHTVQNVLLYSEISKGSLRFLKGFEGQVKQSAFPEVYVVQKTLSNCKSVCPGGRDARGVHIR